MELFPTFPEGSPTGRKDTQYGGFPVLSPPGCTQRPDGQEAMVLLLPSTAEASPQ